MELAEIFNIICGPELKLEANSEECSLKLKRWKQTLAPQGFIRKKDSCTWRFGNSEQKSEREETTLSWRQRQEGGKKRSQVSPDYCCLDAALTCMFLAPEEQSKHKRNQDNIQSTGWLLQAEKPCLLPPGSHYWNPLNRCFSSCIFLHKHGLPNSRCQDVSNVMKPPPVRYYPQPVRKETPPNQVW